jgi:hypothetical protein
MSVAYRVYKVKNKVSVDIFLAYASLLACYRMNLTSVP